MGEKYRMEGEEESLEDAHKMRDELELQLTHSLKQAQRRVLPAATRQPRRTPVARKPAIQRSRRT